MFIVLLLNLVVSIAVLFCVLMFVFPLQLYAIVAFSILNDKEKPSLSLSLSCTYW